MTDKTVYVVMRNADFTEGRGPMVLDSIWSNASEAVKHAESMEPYGSKMEIGKYGYYAYGQFMQIKLENVNESFVDKRKERDEEDRKKALAKLSPKERELLGFGVSE